MNFYISDLRYFEKPDGVDIFAHLFDSEHKQVGWIEQAAYAAPEVYFNSQEIKEKFEAEAGITADDGMPWEEVIENLVQECERKFYGPEEYDKMLKEVLNG